MWRRRVNNPACLVAFCVLQELQTQKTGPKKWAEEADFEVPTMADWLSEGDVKLVSEVAAELRRKTAESKLWPALLKALGLPKTFPKPGPTLCDKRNWIVQAYAAGGCVGMWMVLSLDCMSAMISAPPVSWCHCCLAL
jgi:hypothetical protein